MKIIHSVLLLVLFANVSYSQNASTYFPSAPGYKWFYKNTPLDSLNNPVSSASTFQVDSFAVNQNYLGLPASLVLSKSGLTSINQNAPYLDTNYYNFQSTNGYNYLNTLSLIGSIPIFDSLTFVEFLKSFNAWYNTYRFSQTVNTNYTIFSRDTTVTFNAVDYPLRISSTGRRLADQTISTVNGNYLAKKFIITFGISYGLLPPLIYIPIITLPDTTYIAQDVWVVRDCRPSINVDLTSLGFAVAFTIPGSLQELTSGTTGIISQNNLSVSDYKLSQNYPNPFNPSTNINYELPISNYVSLKVYDALGELVATLVNEKQNAGSYNYQFSTVNYQLSSGIYFYKLEAGDFVETKSMILLK